MSDAASVPSVFTGSSIFAMLGPNPPEWKKIIKIEMTPDGPQSSVVQDYTLVKKVAETVSTAMAELADELADSDDTPGQQQLLMSAWQALAVYLSSCDDEDKPGALQALKMVSNLMADGPDNGPMPTGTFGATTQSAAAVKGKDNAPVPKDKNGKPLPPWLAKKQKKVQADKAAFSCPQCTRDFASEAGLINHLKTLHAAREKQAGYGKNPAAQDKD